MSEVSFGALHDSALTLFALMSSHLKVLTGFEIRLRRDPSSGKRCVSAKDLYSNFDKYDGGAFLSFEDAEFVAKLCSDLEAKGALTSYAGADSFEREYAFTGPTGAPLLEDFSLRNAHHAIRRLEANSESERRVVDLLKGALKVLQSYGASHIHDFENEDSLDQKCAHCDMRVFDPAEYLDWYS